MRRFRLLIGHPFVKGLLRVSGSVGALYLVMRQIDTVTLATTLQYADWRSMGLATGLFTLSKVISAQRLTVLFAADGLLLSPTPGRQLYWLGMFYNLLLPGGIGGDGYKALYLHRKTGRGVRSLLTPILIDRLVGLLMLIVLALAGIATGWSQPAIRWSAIAGAIGFPAIAIWLAGRWLPRYGPYTGRVLGLSAVVQGLQCGSVWLIGLSLNVSGSPLLYMILFLVSSVLAVLPVTVGGAGLRELTFLSGAQYLHLPPADAVSVSLLFYAVTVVVSLTGGYYAWVPPTIPAEAQPRHNSPTKRRQSLLQ